MKVRLRFLALVPVLAAAVSLPAAAAMASTPSSCQPGSSSYPPPLCSASVSATAVPRGNGLHVDGEGFAGNSSVNVYLDSTAHLLGTGTANGLGVLGMTVTIPSSTSLGSHEIIELGTNPNGTARQLTARIAVTAQPAAASAVSSSSLPFTGAQIAGMSTVGLLLVGGGGLMLLAARRRRTAQTRAR